MSTENKVNNDQRYLAFSLGKEQYAIPLLQVKEVIGLTETTPMPYAPDYFKGIMNLRGQVISIIDLRLKFKMATSALSDQTAIVILDLAPLFLGVVVDSVNTVLALTPENISEAPDIETSLKADFIKGVARKDNRLIVLLNIESVLDTEDLRTIKKQLNHEAA